jgi:antirestriction protein ArdC
LPLDERASDRYTRILKIHTVFNAKQIDGIPVYEKTNKQLKFSQIENTFVPTLVKNMRIDVQHGGNEAYYSPTSDLITLPPKKSFHEAYEYTATLLHELAHATSHNTRLDRAVSGKFGSKEYAKEELRAEISSSFVAGELNLNQTSSNLDNHKAYIQN